MAHAAPMIAIRILLAMIALYPLNARRLAADYEQRFILATAIVEATDDPVRQIVLARIARFESGFDPRVGRCERKGPQGELGFFQVKPIAKGDEKRACGSALEQAKLADAYVTRAAEACPGNVGADTLAMYTSGTCARGIREAKNRWGTPETPDLGMAIPEPTPGEDELSSEALTYPATKAKSAP